MNAPLIIAFLGGSLSLASAASELTSLRAWLPAILLTAGFIANFLIS